MVVLHVHCWPPLPTNPRSCMNPGGQHPITRVMSDTYRISDQHRRRVFDRSRWGDRSSTGRDASGVAHRWNSPAARFLFTMASPIRYAETMFEEKLEDVRFQPPTASHLRNLCRYSNSAENWTTSRASLSGGTSSGWIARI
jgi:hypothetical protein